MSGYGKWPESQWRELLGLALPALNDLPGDVSWALGGGTALALRLGHRVSFDIDVFFENSAALRLLHPNLNPKVRALSDRFQNPGNYIKIERPEGEIDFLVAVRITDNPTWNIRINGQDIAVETPAEIIAKKLRYRASNLTLRDAFDIAAIADIDPNSMEIAVRSCSEGALRAVDRLERYSVGRYQRLVKDEVKVTEFGEKYLTADISQLAGWLQELACPGRSPK